MRCLDIMRKNVQADVVAVDGLIVRFSLHYNTLAHCAVSAN